MGRIQWVAARDQPKTPYSTRICLPQCFVIANYLGVIVDISLRCLRIEAYLMILMPAKRGFEIFEFKSFYFKASLRTFRWN